MFIYYHKNHFGVFFPVLQDRVNAVTKEITQMLEQKEETEKENNDLQIKINDQHLEISSLNIFLVEQTKVSYVCKTSF